MSAWHGSFCSASATCVMCSPSTSSIIIVKGTTKGSITTSLSSYRPTRTRVRDRSDGGNGSVVRQGLFKVQEKSSG
jgi:hypothetical protein